MIVNRNERVLHVLTVAVILLAVIASGFGLLDTTPGNTHEYVNQYGDRVKIYGMGLYRNDSYFKAPIFRGTDLIILAVAIPLLVIVLCRDLRNGSDKTKVMLVSALAVVFYYATSIAFGVMYNKLHLVYIALFSTSLFALIIALIRVDYTGLEGKIKPGLPHKGVYFFLGLTGVSLIVAWLPDILAALAANRPLLLIENYTTEITYVLDMGIIAPLCFICIYLVGKKRAIGYVLLDILLTLCIIIGIILPVQTWFQVNAGIDLPMPVLITKMATFCALALFALYFKVKLKWKQ